MHWRVFVIIYVSKYYHIKLNDFVLHPIPFGFAHSPSDSLIFIYAQNRSCANFSSSRFSTLPRKLLSMSASNSRFYYIMSERSMEAWLCTYLASAHSKVNCAINRDRRVRGLLLICLHNAIGLCVSIAQNSMKLILWTLFNQFFSWQYLENLI